MWRAKVLENKTMPGKIFGGDDVNIEDHSYTVSVRLGAEHICGGSVIALECVLTAAHCVEE